MIPTLYCTRFRRSIWSESPQSLHLAAVTFGSDDSPTGTHRTQHTFHPDYHDHASVADSRLSVVAISRAISWIFMDLHGNGGTHTCYPRNMFNRTGPPLHLADAFLSSTPPSPSVCTATDTGPTGAARKQPHCFRFIANVIFNVKVFEFENGTKLAGVARTLQAAHQRQVYVMTQTLSSSWLCFGFYFHTRLCPTRVELWM